METFLNDYGLVWVGNSSSSSHIPDSKPADTPAPAPAPASAPASAAAPAPASEGAGAAAPAPTSKDYPFGILKEKIALLNRVAGEGKAKVGPNLLGARAYGRRHHCTQLTDCRGRWRAPTAHAGGHPADRV